MICTNCSKEIPDGAQFCQYCGASQETPQAPMVETQQDAGGKPPIPDGPGTTMFEINMRKRRQNRKNLWIILGVATVLIALFTAVSIGAGAWMHMQQRKPLNQVMAAARKTIESKSFTVNFDGAERILDRDHISLHRQYHMEYIPGDHFGLSYIHPSHGDAFFFCNHSYAISGETDSTDDPNSDENGCWFNAIDCIGKGIRSGKSNFDGIEELLVETDREDWLNCETLSEALSQLEKKWNSTEYLEETANFERVEKGNSVTLHFDIAEDSAFWEDFLEIASITVSSEITDRYEYLIYDPPALSVDIEIRDGYIKTVEFVDRKAIHDFSLSEYVPYIGRLTFSNFGTASVKHPKNLDK